MRIGIDGRYLADHYPGIGRYLFNLLRSLADLSAGSRDSAGRSEGGRPGESRISSELDFYVLLDPAAENSRYPLRQLRGKGLHLVDARVRLRSLAEQIVLPRLAKELSLDLVHIPYPVTALRWPCPSIVNFYDRIPQRYPEVLPSRWARHLHTLMVGATFRCSAGVLTLTDSSKQEFLEHIGSKAAVGRASNGARPLLFVTPAAADPRFEPASTEAVASVRAELGVPEHYVLFVGTHKPHKNLTRLIDAWAEVSNGSSNGYHLVLAGREDSRFPAARRRARELRLDNVRFLGVVPETMLPGLYSGAALFVLPSLWEGFGMPVLEAMACGVPVACSVDTGVAEVAAGAAAYFDPTDGASITTVIGSLLRDENRRRQLARASRRRAAQLQWEQTARATIAAYQAVLRQAHQIPGPSGLAAEPG